MAYLFLLLGEEVVQVQETKKSQMIGDFSFFHSKTILGLFFIITILISISVLAFFSAFQDRILEHHQLDVSRAITKPQSMMIDLTHPPSSLTVSGKLFGKGTARVSLLYEGKRYLVFDSMQSPSFKEATGIAVFQEQGEVLA